MQKLFLSLLVQIFILPVFAQEAVWKKNIIDEDLTIELPGKPTVTDTTLIVDNKKVRYRVLQFSSETSDFVMTTDEEMFINNAEALDRAYKGMGDGIRKSAEKRRLECIITDTTLSTIRCKKSQLFSKNSINNARAFTFLFIVNSKGYSISVYAPAGQTEQSKTEMNKMLASIHFSAAALKKLPSRAEALGYQIGGLLGYSLILGVIAVVVILIIRAIKK